jgi:putative transposase
MRWIEPAGELPILKQCKLAGVTRSSVYAAQKEPQPVEEEFLLCRLIDEEYTRHPFYGSRRMVVHLNGLGHNVNRKRAQRLMRILGLEGMSPGPNTSAKHPEHKVYPYLLRGLDILRPNHVWSTDITYIRLSRGFAYLVAILDWYSRRVLSWRISMDTTFCVECLEEALCLHGSPEICNTDQGPNLLAPLSQACF